MSLFIPVACLENLFAKVCSLKFLFFLKKRNYMYKGFLNGMWGLATCGKTITDCSPCVGRELYYIIYFFWKESQQTIFLSLALSTCTSSDRNWKHSLIFFFKTLTWHVSHVKKHRKCFQSTQTLVHTKFEIKQVKIEFASNNTKNSCHNEYFIYSSRVKFAQSLNCYDQIFIFTFGQNTKFPIK